MSLFRAAGIAFVASLLPSAFWLTLFTEIAAIDNEPPTGMVLPTAIILALTAVVPCMAPLILLLNRRRAQQGWRWAAAGMLAGFIAGLLSYMLHADAATLEIAVAFIILGVLICLPGMLFAFFLAQPKFPKPRIVEKP